MIDGADWPIFGWSDDIRPALGEALRNGQPAALATLFRVEGSAPRGPGAQMLFVTGSAGDPAAQLTASGYFSGDCIEGDVANHAAEVLATGIPQHLHYGTGSPWIDIRLRCGGTLHILVERVETTAAQRLLADAEARVPCQWVSDGTTQRIETAADAPLLSVNETPLTIARRFDPPRRIIISGGDPGALALARLAAEARFDTWLIRADGPETPPPLPGVTYRREEPARVLESIGVDRWTAYIGATHEDHHDLAACAYALRNGAAWVGMIGAKVRAEGRRDVLRQAGVTEDELARLQLSPGVPGLGKAPWEVATGIIAEIMQAMNPNRERA